MGDPAQARHPFTDRDNAHPRTSRKRRRPVDSATLLKLGFCEWRPFGNAITKPVSQNSGVYAFRRLTSLALRIGSSDITQMRRAMSDRKQPYLGVIKQVYIVDSPSVEDSLNERLLSQLRSQWSLIGRRTRARLKLLEMVQ